MDKDERIFKFVEEHLFDEINSYIEEGILDSYESFEYSFSNIKPTKELYERLKENDNWALYDYVENYDKYYPGWQKILVNAFKKALKENKKEIDAEMDFLESDELSDASANIGSGIIADAIKGERKKMKNEK